MSNIYWSLFQAEEEYNEAKSVYTKLHAELYEELPALFDRLELLQYFYQFFFVRSSDIHVAPLQFTRVLHYRRYLQKEVDILTCFHLVPVAIFDVRDVNVFTA